MLRKNRETKCFVYACVTAPPLEYTVRFKMAAGDNSGRPPCLNFSGQGSVGNGQPSNSLFTMPTSNSGSIGQNGGAQGSTRRPNPQVGPGEGESNGLAAGAQPNAHNSIQQQAQGAAAGTAGGAMATLASNMTSAASNAPASAAPSTHPSLSATPASVLVYREPVYNWQATKSTVKERFAFLFNNEVLSDVHFLVGKGMGVQRIPAHRYVFTFCVAHFMSLDTDREWNNL